MPGTATAVGVVLPYSVWAIAAMRASFGVSSLAFLSYAVVGALLQPVVILLFLGISYGAVQVMRQVQGML